MMDGEDCTSQEEPSNIIEKEVRWYTSLPATKDKNEDPLQWWQKNKNTFPHLANVVKKYMAIPATSVPSERLFSVAGNIVTDKRNSLKPANVNRLCFLAANL